MDNGYHYFYARPLYDGSRYDMDGAFVIIRTEQDTDRAVIVSTVPNQTEAEWLVEELNSD